jgi:hypothetical protein
MNNMMVMVAGGHGGGMAMTRTVDIRVLIVRAARVMRAVVGNIVVVSSHLGGRGSEKCPSLSAFSPKDSQLTDLHVVEEKKSLDSQNDCECFRMYRDSPKVVKGNLCDERKEC